MAYPLGSVPYTTNLGTTDAADTFPTHLDYLGYGGMRTVVDNTARDAITSDRRAFGMLVYSIGSLVTYQLCNIVMGGASNTLTDNANWKTYAGGGVTLTTIGSTPNANGMTLAAGILNLEPASATFGGIVTTGTQTFAGVKTFSSAPKISTLTSGSVLFAGAGGVISEDNGNFLYNPTTNRLLLHNTGSGSPDFIFSMDRTATVANQGCGLTSYDNTNHLSFICRRANGTFAAPTAVNSGTILAQFEGRGYDSFSTAFSTTARAAIRMYAAETWNAGTNQGTYMNIATTPIGSTTLTTAITILDNGNVGIFDTNPANALSVTGTGAFEGTMQAGTISLGDYINAGSVALGQIEIQWNAGGNTHRFTYDSTPGIWQMINGLGNQTIRSYDTGEIGFGTQAVSASLMELVVDINNVKTYVNSRFEEKQGDNVTAANNTTLTANGNVFLVIGNTQINLILGTNWQDGSTVTLLFAGTPTVKHNQAISGAYLPIKLAGSVDFSAVADSRLVLTKISTAVATFWYEVARTVA